MGVDTANSTKRFSDRVSNYSRYRPGYPVQAIEWVFQNAPLNSNSKVADVGSGTGIFTEELINKGVSVVAVEPNDAMRLESDKRLGDKSNYSSEAGTAEHTKLEADSIDLVTAAQAFHWFDLEKTKSEFARILKSNGKVLLIWNRRDNAGSEFLAEYEHLLSTRIPEYNKVTHANSTDAVIADFLGENMTTADFPSHQVFDLDGLKGRLQSSSYCPAEGKSGHTELMDAITNLYDKYSSDQGVQFDYCTQIYMS